MLLQLFSLLAVIVAACEEREDALSVRGRLIDRGRPVAGASLDIDGLAQYQSVTDANGEFVITAVDPGIHQLNFSKHLANSSYSQRSETISISSTSLELNNLVLPEPVVLREPEIEQSVSGNSIRLSWSPYAAPDFREYKVYAQNIPGLDESTGELVYVTTNVNDTTFMAELPHGSSQYYRVFILSEYGFLGGSNLVQAVTSPYINDPVISIGSESVYVLNRDETLWLSFDAIEGGYYSVAWFDGWFDHTAESIYVSAWDQDKIMRYFNPYRLIQMNGSPVPIKSASNKVHLKIEGYDESVQGTFAVKVDKLNKESAVNLALGEAGIQVSIRPGESKLLAFDAEAGATYTITAYNDDVGLSDDIATNISIYSDSEDSPFVHRANISTAVYQQPWSISTDVNQKIYILVTGAYWWLPQKVFVAVKNL